jgi:hypothetical protein
MKDWKLGGYIDIRG